MSSNKSTKKRTKALNIEAFQMLKSTNAAITRVISYGGFVLDSREFSTCNFFLTDQGFFENFGSVHSLIISLKTPWQQECMYSGTKAFMKSNPGKSDKGVGPQTPWQVFPVALTIFRSSLCCSMLLNSYGSGFSK